MKTKKNKQRVKIFLDSIPDPVRRNDCRQLLRLMQKITGNRAAMWGATIVGFGTFHYQYPSGREGDWFITGFSPRKQYLVLYGLTGKDTAAGLMNKLGRYKTGKACLCINKLEDIDLGVLEQLIHASVSHLKVRRSGKRLIQND